MQTKRAPGIVKTPVRTKISMNLHVEDLETIEQLAEWRRTTKTEAIRGAIATERLMQEAIQRGARILIEEPGEPAKQIVFR